MSNEVKFTLSRTVGKNALERANSWGGYKHPYKSEETCFPDDFFWSGAMCATQAEGAYDEDGKGLSAADVVPLGDKRLDIAKGKIANYNCEIGEYFPSRKAIDFYHHYKEDIKLMADLGLNAYKLSISWARIFPTGKEEKPNEKGLAFYNDVIDELKKNGIEPIIEIVHWDLPLQLSIDHNGWQDRLMVDEYLKLVKALCESFGHKVKYWLTIHEPDCMHDYPFVACGLVKKDEESWAQIKLNASHHMFVASAKACEYIRSKYPEAIVGTMIGLTYKYAYSADPRDQLAAVKDKMINWLYSDVMVRGYYPSYALVEFERKGLKIPFEEGDEELLRNNTISFMMFSYYNSLVIRHDSDDVITNPYVGDAADPMGLRVILNIMYDRYQIPIILGELAFKSKDELDGEKVHDEARATFIAEHLKAIKDSIFIDGVDVKGCMFWETIDNISVSKGIMSERYGLIYADVDDYGNGSFKRYPKDSYYALQKIIADKGKCL